VGNAKVFLSDKMKTNESGTRPAGLGAFLGKDCGFGMGLEFREPTMVLSHENNEVRDSHTPHTRASTIFNI
jgi:hypothetical protein